MTPLKELFAFVAESPDGKEGIASIQIADQVWLPLVAQTREELDLYRPVALQLAESLKKPVTLSRFTVRENIDIIQ